jgi:hypothetical protein
MAVMPIVGERTRLPATWRPLLSPLGLVLATAAATVAATRLSIARPALADLSFDFAGSALLGVVIVLIVGVLLAPVGDEWAALLAVVALLATAPSLRWAAIAALAAVSTLLERSGERPVWLAVMSLSLGSVLQALAPPALSARLQTVALAIGLTLMVYAARAGLLRVMLLPAAVFIALGSVEAFAPGNLTRFQWIVAAGALLLIGRALLSLLRSDEASAAIREPLIIGLLLLAISARDAPGLGALAVVLLVIDLALVRPGVVSAQPTSLAAGLLTLAKSCWPPSVTFAGATFAVIAALQASLALGLLAALMLAGLVVAPLFDRDVATPVSERPRSSFQWIAPALSIACGVAPAVVLRMLRL